MNFTVVLSWLAQGWYESLVKTVTEHSCGHQRAFVDIVLFVSSIIFTEAFNYRIITRI